MRPHAHRHPKSTPGFSWARIPEDDACTWRLFRRDHRGKLHMFSLRYAPASDRQAIAGALRHARRLLRDRVDEIDLAALEAA